MNDDCKSCNEWDSNHYMYILEEGNIPKRKYVPNPQYEHIIRCASCKYEDHDPCWSCLHRYGFHEDDCKPNCQYAKKIEEICPDCEPDTVCDCDKCKCDKHKVEEDR